MSSLKSLSAKIRREPPFYSDHDRAVFSAAVLEIAHMISRGRKPNSCSVLPGQNIQTWMRRTFTENYTDCHDYMGEECSIADDIQDALEGWCYGDPKTWVIVHAINVCRRHVRPIKKPKESRGDWCYQEAHKVTNLKRKMAWHERTQGSCYDEIDYRDCDPFCATHSDW